MKVYSGRRRHIALGWLHNEKEGGGYGGGGGEGRVENDEKAEENEKMNMARGNRREIWATLTIP